VFPAEPDEGMVMSAIEPIQKGQLARAAEPGGQAVQAKARLALDITPKRFRLTAGAVFTVPLRLLDLLRDWLRMLF
jgi:hypothetical protein